MFFSESFCMIFATAISKSSCVTWTRRSRNAYMPASVQTPFNSAPLAPGIDSAIFFRFMPRVRFILREWILRISKRASSLGGGNSILRSIRPGPKSHIIRRRKKNYNKNAILRNKAGSNISMRLVAMMTLMFFVASNPSSWLRNSNIVR